MIKRSGFSLAIDNLSGPFIAKVPDWAWHTSATGYTIIIGSEALRHKFGEMSGQQTDAIRQEIRARLISFAERKIVGGEK